jgi:hypothetical protein
MSHFQQIAGNYVSTHCRRVAEGGHQNQFLAVTHCAYWITMKTSIRYTWISMDYDGHESNPIGSYWILLDPVGFLAGLWCQCAQENPTGCLALCNIARSARNDKEKLVRRGIFWHLKTLSKQNQQVDSLWAHVFLRTGCLKDAFKERQPRTSMINVRETLNACILLDAPSNLNRGSGSPGTVSPTTLCTYVHKLHLPGQKADAKK